jgi:small multidrug resistance pump
MESRYNNLMKTLKLAAIYNIIWGTFVILFPNAFFDIINMERPNYPEIWQCVGMIVGVYGVGYWIAAQDPIKHYPIVLVGFLGKILGPIGFAQALFTDRFPLAFGINIIFNDLIWWIPFFNILREKYQRDKTFLS